MLECFPSVRDEPHSCIKHELIGMINRSIFKFVVERTRKR